MNNYFTGCLHRRTLFAQNGTPVVRCILFCTLIYTWRSCWIPALTNLRNTQQQRVARDCRAYINEAFVIECIFPFLSSSVISATPQNRIFQKNTTDHPNWPNVVSLYLFGAICDYILFGDIPLFWRFGISASSSAGIYDSGIRQICIYKKLKRDTAKGRESHHRASSSGWLLYQQGPLSAPPGRK